MNSFEKVLIALIVVGVIVVILTWSSLLDERRNEWADAYEKCVAEEYNTTPSAYYAQHGEYPYCDTRP